MKFKNKLGRIIGASSIFGLVITTPIILTACNSSSTTNSEINNGSNGSNTDNGNNSNGDASGGNKNDGSSGSNDETQTCPSYFTPTLTTNYSLVGIANDLSNSSFINNVYNQLNTITAKRKLILNNSTLTNNDLDNIKILFIPGSFNRGNWGSISYETWKENIPESPTNNQNKLLSNQDTTVHQLIFNGLNQKIHISNSLNLYDYLTMNSNKNLNSLFESSYILDGTSKPSIQDLKLSLVPSSNLGFENNLIHINISNTDSNNNVVYYDLQIPQSCINFSLNNCSLAAVGKNINSVVKTNFSLLYNLSIDTNINNYTNSNVIVPSSADKNLNGVLNSLNLGTSSALNNNNISKLFGIYNVTFSNAKINQVSTREITSDSSPNINYYLSFDARPNIGYTWKDGSSRVITISTKNLTVNIETATANKNVSIKSFNCLKDLKVYDSEHFSNYFLDENNFNDFINNYVLKTNTEKVTNFADVDFKFISATYKVSGLTSLGTVILEVTPKIGYCFNNQNNNIEGSTKPVQVTINLEKINFPVENS